MQKSIVRFLIALAIMVLGIGVINASAQDLPTPTLEVQTDLFGLPPAPIQLTPVVRQNPIDWNERLQIDQWMAAPGLAPNVNVWYVQSAVERTLTLENFQIPEGAMLVFGGVAVDITVDAAGTPIRRPFSGGVYGVVKQDTILSNFVLTDGFALLAKPEDAHVEFCYRIAQAQAEKWALSLTFPDPSWGEQPCSGEFEVPLDSDRLNGGSLPSGTPAPQQSSSTTAETAVVPEFMQSQNVQQITGCTVSGNTVVNVRSGPGTSYSSVKLSVGTHIVDSSIVGDDGYTWWHLADGGYVRHDVVQEEGNCPTAVSPF